MHRSLSTSHFRVNCTLLQAFRRLPSADSSKALLLRVLRTLDDVRSKSQSDVFVRRARARVLGALWCLSQVRALGRSANSLGSTDERAPSLSVQRARSTVLVFSAFELISSESVSSGQPQGMIEQEGKAPFALIRSAAGLVQWGRV